MKTIKLNQPSNNNQPNVAAPRPGVISAAVNQQTNVPPIPNPVAANVNQQSYGNELFQDVPSSTKVILRGALFIGAPAQQPLVYRPLTVKGDKNSMLQLQNVTDGGKFIDPNAVRGIANEIIKLSDSPRGNIGIVGDWNQSRCSVFLDFEIQSGNMSYREVLNCYTNAELISHNNIADDIQIFVNSVIRVGQREIRNATGARRVCSVKNNAQVLRPTMINNGASQIRGEHTMRATDLVNGFQLVNQGHSDAYDPRSDLKASTNTEFGVAADRIRTSSMATMLSDVLTGFSAAHATNQEDHRNDINAVMGTVASGLREEQLVGMTIFNKLKAKTNYGMAGFFTWTELKRAVDVVNHAGVRPVPLMPGVPDAMSMAGWNTYGHQVMCATELTHVIPALCSQFMASSFKFSARNLGGRMEFLPSDFKMMFDGMDEPSFASQLMAVIQSEALPEIFKQERCYTWELECEYILGGLMMIRIKLDGEQQWNDYMMPSYCDHLSSRVVATDSSEVRQNGFNLGKLVTSTFTGVTPDAPMQQYV